MKRHLRLILAWAALLASTLACFPTFEPRPNLQFGPDTLPPAQVGAPYKVDITISGNVTPVFDISANEDALPDGLTLEYNLNDSYARLVGTPTQTGTFKFKVSAMCYGTNVSGQTGEREFTIEVR